jgi:hypothetical protein
MQNKDVLDMKWIFYINNAMEDNFKEKIGYIHSWNITRETMEEIKNQGALARVIAYHFDMSKGEGHSSDQYPYVVYTLYFNGEQDSYCVAVSGLEQKDIILEIPKGALNSINEIKELQNQIHGA